MSSPRVITPSGKQKTDPRIGPLWAVAIVNFFGVWLVPISYLLLVQVIGIERASATSGVALALLIWTIGLSLCFYLVDVVLLADHHGDKLHLYLAQAGFWGACVAWLVIGQQALEASVTTTIVVTILTTVPMKMLFYIKFGFDVRMGNAGKAQMHIM